MLTLHNVISADGYITDKEGSEDFISDELWPTTLNLFKKFDVLVMGRKTYDTIQNYDQQLLKPFEELTIKKAVVTKNLDLSLKPGYIAVQTPEEVIGLAENILVSSGPTLNNYFLEKDLVNEIIFHQLPTVVGEGVKPLDEKIYKKLTLVSETKLDQVKKLVYKL